ncbi:REP-associated tyrosine transposase [Propionivibrio sp.]|uniref:REP-associated tyrosine transposase n=1 Tax=Propionivibrio sp. TaxID=2212460 RepID=UPI003BF33DA3
MARLPRFVVPGQPQHVIVRGNNRSEIFCADEDYRFYLEKLQLACKRHGCEIHAYVLMTNHVHLLMTPHAEQSLSKTLQMLGRYYVQYFNYCYRRTGTLWEGRYKATLIDSEAYLLTCMRYIELNPVRAAIVSLPTEYPWSSYPCNALGKADVLVTPSLEYTQLGLNDTERQAAYRQLFENHIADTEVNEIREATNKAWVLGRDRFKQQIQQQLTRRVDPAARGGDRKSDQFQRNSLLRIDGV